MDKHKISIMATAQLKQIYGEDATFREGQYQAIEATLTQKRTLVVQKTGWGKSLVYFLSTKINRSFGAGLTLVVSPLLVLMENQMEAAVQMGLTCYALNGRTRDQHDTILAEMVDNQADVVFVTPETLFSDRIQRILHSIHIGLFVIDEAHCISDWGHDFRLQYGNLYKILAILPVHIPVLATTATANHRVVADLKQQLGQDVFVSRGSLLRKSLFIQILPLQDTASRYGWILENLERLHGSGIIYCLTQRDCDHLTTFLCKNRIRAMSYYARPEEYEYLNQEAEQAFLYNKIKLIVATIKLGMGYDKGDIGFVIHFQQPSNIVSYYQQIGRAGRAIPRADTFLMTGGEDSDIQDYFINTAFPSKQECIELEQYIFQHTDSGVSLNQLTTHINMRKGRMEKALMFLQHDGAVVKHGHLYHSGVNTFFYDEEKYASITSIRKAEQKAMELFSLTSVCYNQFVVNHLDDDTIETCGICANCLGYEPFPVELQAASLQKAQQYLERLQIPILPRKRWATTSITKQTKIPIINQEGICLSKYGDPGYGLLVKRDKYGKEHRFCDELVGKTVEVLRDVIKHYSIKAITFVPSLHSSIVADFAMRVAERCQLPCLCLLEKHFAQPQKEMENTSHQCENAKRSFAYVGSQTCPDAVVLIDDIIDSKWTITVCGDLLASNGATIVVPFALADSSTSKE